MKIVTKNLVKLEAHEFEYIRRATACHTIVPNLEDYINEIATAAFNEGVDSEKLARSKSDESTEKAQEIFGDVADDEIKKLEEIIRSQSILISDKSETIKTYHDKIAGFKNQMLGANGYLSDKGIARSTDGWLSTRIRDFQLNLESDHKKVVGPLKKENAELKKSLDDCHSFLDLMVVQSTDESDQNVDLSLVDRVQIITDNLQIKKSDLKVRVCDLEKENEYTAHELERITQENAELKEEIISQGHIDSGHIDIIEEHKIENEALESENRGLHSTHENDLEEIEGLKESLKEHREAVVNKDAAIKHLREALEVINSESENDAHELHRITQENDEFKSDIEAAKKSLTGLVECHGKSMKELVLSTLDLYLIRDAEKCRLERENAELKMRVSTLENDDEAEHTAEELNRMMQENKGLREDNAELKESVKNSKFIYDDAIRDGTRVRSRDVRIEGLKEDCIVKDTAIQKLKVTLSRSEDEKKVIDGWISDNTKLKSRIDILESDNKFLRCESEN